MTMPRMTGCTANLLSSFPLGKRTQLLHESRNFCICRWYMDKPVSQPMFHNVIIAIFHAAISLPWLPCHPAHTYGHGFCPNRTCHLCQTPMLTPGSPTTTPLPNTWLAERPVPRCGTGRSASESGPFCNAKRPGFVITWISSDCQPRQEWAAQMPAAASCLASTVSLPPPVPQAEEQA